MANTTGVKYGGRTKGVKNKISKVQLVNSFIEYIVEGGFIKFQEEFNKLEGKEYIDAFLKFSSIYTTKENIIKGNDELITHFVEKLKAKKITIKNN
jgi:hypothetical protein